jgi:hypothetical protein
MPKDFAVILSGAVCGRIANGAVEGPPYFAFLFVILSAAKNPRISPLSLPVLHAPGLNIIRIETKINPKQITSSSHHRSSHDSLSLAKLIRTSSFTHLSILPDNQTLTQSDRSWADQEAWLQRLVLP